MLCTEVSSRSSRSSDRTPTGSLTTTRTSITARLTTSSVEKSCQLFTTTSRRESPSSRTVMAMAILTHRCILQTRLPMVFGISRMPQNLPKDSGASGSRFFTRPSMMDLVARSFSRVSGKRFAIPASRARRRLIKISSKRTRSMMIRRQDSTTTLTMA